MSTLTSKSFWVDAAERAIKAFAGGIVTGFGSDAVNLHVFRATVAIVLVRSALLAVVSLALSVASSPRSNTVSPASIAPGPPAGAAR